MFHDVTPQGERSADPYTLDAAVFDELVQGLAAAGHQSPPWPDLLAGSAPARSVVFTFDDARRGVLEAALPALQRAGFVGVVYAIAERLGAPGYLDGAELRSLLCAGWTVGSHGLDHAHLSSLSATDLRVQLRESRRILGAALGAPVYDLSLPGGRGGRRERHEALQSGYRSLATSVPALWRPPLSPLAVPRLAVRSGHDAAALNAMATGARAAVWRQRLRYLPLEFLKRGLGDGLYDGLRERLLGVGAGRRG